MITNSFLSYGIAFLRDGLWEDQGVRHNRPDAAEEAALALEEYARVKPLDWIVFAVASGNPHMTGMTLQIRDDGSLHIRDTSEEHMPIWCESGLDEEQSYRELI